MRIGLFPSKKQRVGNGVDSLELSHENAFKNEVFKQEKGGNENQQELRLDGATVLLRKLSLDSFSTSEYENAHFCFGIHFLLEGNYKFISSEVKAKVGINSGCYNIVQWPKILGTQKLKGLEYVSVDIFFTEEFLEDLLGTEYDSVFEGFLGVLGNDLKCLWSKGQPIPAKPRVLLLEILNCPFTGHSRTKYIESQIRCLVIEVLLGREYRIGEIEEFQEPRLSKLDHDTIENVVSYIKQHLKRKLTIKELSEIAGFNTTKLKSCFKKIHQTTIFKYITRLRMEKAITLIRDDNLSIAQAAYEVGYSNPQHFTVAFKKTMGYLPSALLGAPQ